MILDGKALSKKINDQLKEEVGALIEKTNIIPRMAIVLVGENHASDVYVRNKVRAANHVGIDAKVIKLTRCVTRLLRAY
jgi:methylenetetrahydrofolate dehydrogenase (NADP+)/methenyltetrahydrofolate cyclohydrolase